LALKSPPARPAAVASQKLPELADKGLKFLQKILLQNCRFPVAYRP
jgi:hypothetical protein